MLQSRVEVLLRGEAFDMPQARGDVTQRLLLWWFLFFWMVGTVDGFSRRFVPVMEFPPWCKAHQCGFALLGAMLNLCYFFVGVVFRGDIEELCGPLKREF